ncbi:hypothetical protein LINGRAHAP2_LOCUS29413 [Linum grandiflorum]
MMPRYSVSAVWNTICPLQAEVGWYVLVWSPPCIPKHCFISWLAVRGKVVTSSQMAAWGISLDISCLKCPNGVDVIHHLMRS